MSKISAYTPLPNPRSDDLLPVVDVHDTSTPPAGSGGSDKTITLGQVVPVYNVRLYGAAGNGSTDDTTAIQAAVTACIAGGGGVVYLPAGNYKTSSTITALIPTGTGNSSGTGAAVRIQGDGNWATTVSYYGSGDCLRIYSTEYPYGGGIAGLTIDGAHSSASAASTGLHMGDIFHYEVAITVQNFSQFAGSIGIHFDNQYAWTEQLYGRVYAQNCTSHVVFDHGSNAACTGSYDRLDMQFYIDQQNTAYDGVVLQNGTYWLDGAVAIRGNFATSASALTSAVLRITGTAPVGTADAGTYSGILNCQSGHRR